MALIKRGDVWWLRKKIKGKRYRISTGIPVGTKAQREAAARRASEIELEIHEGRLGWTKDCPTLGAWWKTYKEVYSAKKRAPHRDDQVMKHALEFFGTDRLLDSVQKSDCLRYLHHRLTSYAQQRGRKTLKIIAEGTVSRERSFLQALWEQAVADELVGKNPWRGIERKPYAVRDRVLTDEEQGILLARLSPKYQRFVLFLLGTGLRLEECRGIDPKRDINWGQRLIQVTGKFGKSREVPFPAELVQILHDQMKNEGGLWRQAQSRLRTILAQACVYSSVGGVQGKQMLPAPPLPHLSPHALRHTFGWRWLRGGGDIYTLSRILGHSSVAVTERHYAHLMKEDLVMKADQVDLGLGLSKPPTPTPPQTKAAGSSRSGASTGVSSPGGGSNVVAGKFGARR